MKTLNFRKHERLEDDSSGRWLADKVALWFDGTLLGWAINEDAAHTIADAFNVEINHLNVQQKKELDDSNAPRLKSYRISIKNGYHRISRDLLLEGKHFITNATGPVAWIIDAAVAVDVLEGYDARQYEKLQRKK